MRMVFGCKSTSFFHFSGVVAVSCWCCCHCSWCCCLAALWYCQFHSICHLLPLASIIAITFAASWLLIDFSLCCSSHIYLSYAAATALLSAPLWLTVLHFCQHHCCCHCHCNYASWLMLLKMVLLLQRKCPCNCCLSACYHHQLIVCFSEGFSCFAFSIAVSTICILAVTAATAVAVTIFICFLPLLVSMTVDNVTPWKWLKAFANNAAPVPWCTCRSCHGVPHAVVSQE